MSEPSPATNNIPNGTSPGHINGSTKIEPTKVDKLPTKIPEVDPVKDVKKDVIPDEKKAPVDTKKNPVSEPESLSAQDNYPWEAIGGFNKNKKFDRSFINGSHNIKAYISEVYYSDLYWNTSLIIGSCILSWFVAKWRFGIFGLIFVLLGTASVYKAEFRRFKRNIRDDIQRNYSAERVEKNLESMEWLNSFMTKFWVIYMPALSDTVKTIANEVLKDIAPGYGIDALTLDEFTLGTKAPRIDSIKSYTKKGRDHVEMDWAFSFTPDDTSDMTKRQIDKKINPKVALGVRVGKAFISKVLPILVEDMSISGRLKVAMSLSLNFPHIKIVSVQLLEPPKIDFALKPVGGDTFGLDIMSLIPGLSTLITTLINSNVGPMLYAPNHFDIDVEELMQQQANDAIGVVALTVKSVTDLKKPINPYVQIELEGEPDKYVRTDVKAQTKEAYWSETKYILVNDIQKKLNFELYDFDITKKKGEFIASHVFDLDELLQKDNITNLTKPLLVSGKKKADVNYDIRWFPALSKTEDVEITEDESNETEIADSEVGILKFTLHQARGLDNTLSLVGLLSPKADLFINGRLTKSFRTMKRSNEPHWEEHFEMLITQKASTQIKLVLTDISGSEIGSLSESLDTLSFNVSQGDDYFPLSTQGEVRLSAIFKPVSLSGVSSTVNYVPPLGVVRLHLRSGKDLLNLETVGDVDPYVKVLLANRLKYQTEYHPDTRNPDFNEVIYIPVVSPSQQITLEVMDFQTVTKDRSLGLVNVPVSKLIKKSSDGSLLFHDGANTVLTSKLQLKNKKPKGDIVYSVSFLPTLPVYSLTELEELERRKKQIAEKKVKQEEELKAWEELYKKTPDAYEWVEAEDVDDEDDGSKKAKLSLDELLTNRSGVLSVHFIDGQVKKPDVFIQVLMDNIGTPSFVTSRTSNRKVNPEVGDAFVRDLPNSKIIFRVTKKPKVKDVDQVYDEKIFSTIDLLKKGYTKPIVLGVGSSQIKVRFEYIPSAIKLPPSETILDTGRVDVEFLDGDNLPSHDRNGKSDPFITVTRGEVEFFKSKVVKKTLNPTWNESTSFPVPTRSRSLITLNVFDWDRAGKNDLLGSTLFDISNVEPLKTQLITFQLKPQGIVRANITFRPEYIRPIIGTSEYGMNLGSLAGAPLRNVGAAAGVASGAAGAAAGAATGVATGAVGAGAGAVGAGAGALTSGVGKSSSLLKTVITGKKSKQSFDQQRSPGNQTSDTQSLRSGFAPPRPSGAFFAPSKHSRSPSDISTYTNLAKDKRSTAGVITIRNGENLGPQAQLKVSLAIKGKLRHIYSSKNSKASKGLIRWDEDVQFDAPQDAEIVFGGVVHRTLARDHELGTTAIKLSEVIDNPRDIELNLGQGRITVNFKYSPEPSSSGSGTPSRPAF